MESKNDSIFANSSEGGNREELYNLIVEHSPLAYVITDGEFNILYANKYVENISGYLENELVGKKCYDYFGNGKVCPACPVHKCVKTGKYETLLKLEHNRFGKEKYLELKAIPLFDDNGNINRVLEIIMDVTEEVSLQIQIKNDYYKMIEMLSSIIEIKDAYTANHSKNVKDICNLIATEMNLSLAQRNELMIAASLHDIGKVGIFDHILTKQGALSSDERTIVESHAILGEAILQKIESFKNIKLLVRHHHERYDGKGYPDGLKGDAIPIESRIIAVADAYDAMASDRAYRKALPKEQIIEEFMKCSGTQFDPEIAKVMLKIIEQGTERG